MGVGVSSRERQGCIVQDGRNHRGSDVVRAQQMACKGQSSRPECWPSGVTRRLDLRNLMLDTVPETELEYWEIRA